MSHTAIITQAGTSGYLLASPPEGYLVTCPHGCKLGSSARQPTREGAERRVALHRAATTPLAAPSPHGVTDREGPLCAAWYADPETLEAVSRGDLPDCGHGSCRGLIVGSQS